ncbi:MAG TPA: hypothetical protein PKW24_06850 [Clostridiales bacterium]|nr:hypothetical protein [Clostridiales bacterium]
MKIELPFEIVDFEQVRLAMANWLMRNKIGYPSPGSEQAADFLDSFSPELPEFEYSDSFIGDDGEVKLLFKAKISLPAWRTKAKTKDLSFTFYKVEKACLNEEGEIETYELCGYILTDI